MSGMVAKDPDPDIFEIPGSMLRIAPDMTSTTKNPTPIATTLSSIASVDSHPSQ